MASLAGKTCKDPLVLVEQKLDFSRFVPGGFGTGDCLIIADGELQVIDFKYPGGFGTGDCLIIADGELQVIDFKYGTGVQVEAKNNPQMMCYALGAMLLYDGIYDIDSVKMTIWRASGYRLQVRHRSTGRGQEQPADDVLCPWSHAALRRDL